MKTKTVLVILFLTTIKSMAQTRSDIKPLSRFQGDTVAYIQDNFIDKKQLYTHRPFNDLLHDIEIPVGSFNIAAGTHPELSPYLTISFYKAADMDYKILNNKHPLVINVVWDSAASIDSIFHLLRKHGTTWSADAQQYFGKLLIKDILLTNYVADKRN